MRSTTRNELINDDVSDDEEIYLGNDSDLPERLDKLIDAYSTVLSKKANADWIRIKYINNNLMKKITQILEKKSKYEELNFEQQK